MEKTNSNGTHKFKITEITAWEANRPIVQATADHSDESYDTVLAEAQEMARNALSNGAGVNLPFICDAKDEKDALAQYVEKFYLTALAIPVEAVIEHQFTVSLQVDCRVDVTVWAQDFYEAGACAVIADIKDLPKDYIETHAVNGTDEVTGEFKDLC